MRPPLPCSARSQLADGRIIVRISIFYCGNGLTNVFGGLIAYGVTFYKGDGIAHWRIVSRLARSSYVKLRFTDSSARHSSTSSWVRSPTSSASRSSSGSPTRSPRRPS